jgi:hypothetical protein
MHMHMQHQAKQEDQPLLPAIETGIAMIITAGIVAEDERFGISNEYGQIMPNINVLRHHQVLKQQSQIDALELLGSLTMHAYTYHGAALSVFKLRFV